MRAGYRPVVPARPLTTLLATATAVVGLLCGCAGPGGAGENEPVPTFSSTPSAGSPLASRAPRTTLLPADCTEVLAGPGMSALLGLPVDSVDVRTVLGQPAPSVGRLERVSCLYRRTGNRAATPDLAMALAAYDTSESADGQLRTNLASERPAARAADDLAIGSARATLLDEGATTVLLVTSGRFSLSMTMRDGVVAPAQVRAVLVDLAQRTLPALAPEPPTASR